MPIESLTHLQRLEAESIHILREVQAELTRRHTGTAPEPVPPTEQTWRAEVTERLERIENALERLVSLVTERNDADEDVPH